MNIFENKAFFLNFDDNSTIERVLNSHKKWFLGEATLPIYMHESVASSSKTLSDSEMASSASTVQIRYLKANASLADIQPSLVAVQQNKYEDIQIGYTRSLQIFFSHSSNLFLNRYHLLRMKPSNICTHALDIYKTLIKTIQIDSTTW